MADLHLHRDHALGLARAVFIGTSMGAVAAELSIDRASIYYYISSKEELFDEVVRAVIERNAALARRVEWLEANGHGGAWVTDEFATGPMYEFHRGFQNENWFNTSGMPCARSSASRRARAASSCRWARRDTGWSWVRRCCSTSVPTTTGRACPRTPDQRISASNGTAGRPAGP